MKKDHCKMINDQLAILNEKQSEKLSFTGCEEWMKRGDSPLAKVDILLSSAAN